MEEGEWPRYFYGTPERVHEQLQTFAAALGLDELIAVTIVHDHAARLRSYELLAALPPRMQATFHASQQQVHDRAVTLRVVWNLRRRQGSE